MARPKAREAVVLCCLTLTGIGQSQGASSNFSSDGAGAARPSEGPPSVIRVTEQPTAAPETSDANAVLSLDHKVHSLVDLSKLYLNTGDLETAEEFSRQAAQDASPGSLVCREARELLSDVLKQKAMARQTLARASKLRHELMLKQAASLIDLKRPEDAIKLICEVMAQTDDPNIVATAEITLERMDEKWYQLNLQRLSFGVKCVLEWVFWVALPITLGVVLVWLLWRVGRFLIAWIGQRVGLMRCKWRIEEMTDKTGLDIVPLVVSNLQEINAQLARKSLPAGLLQLEGPRLPYSLGLLPSHQSQDVVLTAGTLPSVAGIDLGVMANLIRLVLRIARPNQPSITGTALRENDQLIVRLTARTTRGKLHVVSVAGNIEPQKGLAGVLAEEVSFKMLYLISSDFAAGKTESAAGLRRGLGLLDRYIGGGKPDKLQQAYEVFANVRRENPTFDEAHLYEGIALDLLEEHVKACEHFEYLRTNSDNEDLKRQAAYNQAISHFRKYNYTDLQRAISLCEGLIEDESRIREPIEALALAAKTNALAHIPIFWKSLVCEPDVTDHERISDDKKGAVRTEVQRYWDEVETTADKLEMLLPRFSRKWQDATIRQIKWAIKNACGNLRLNCAKTYIGTSHLEEPFSQRDRENYLKEALTAFRSCEVLLSPGVETLTNLGTVLLELKHYDESREYCSRAIKFNENYEYSYYRLAQSWEQQGKRDEVITILRSLPRAPRIPGFKRMYDKYGVEHQPKG